MIFTEGLKKNSDFSKVYKKKMEKKYRAPFSFRQTQKFKNNASIDFRLCLENLGFGDMYDDNYDSFHGAFNIETTNNINIYLQTLKQKNQVEFNEDGTIVKSVTMAAAGGKGGSWKEVDTLDVKLNQPFIYIIRDANNTPIFVGHIDNPQA